MKYKYLLTTKIINGSYLSVFKVSKEIIELFLYYNIKFFYSMTIYNINTLFLDEYYVMPIKITFPWLLLLSYSSPEIHKELFLWKGCEKKFALCLSIK